MNVAGGGVEEGGSKVGRGRDVTPSDAKWKDLSKTTSLLTVVRLAGDLDARKSTSGYMFVISCGAVSWCYKL